MSTPALPPRPGTSAAVPSSRTLVTAAAIAFAVAMVLLVTIILPAEYGIDPLGTGESTGLISLSRTPPPPIEASPSGPVRPQKIDYKADKRQFELAPYGGYVEYKYPLDAGATMLYMWTASDEVNFDFHTEPSGQPPEASDSFERGSAREGRGSYTAPYAGVHGWFWENTSEDAVTVTVTTVGFYEGSKEFRDDGTTEDHAVQDFAPPLLPVSAP